MPCDTKINVKTSNGKFTDGTQAIELKVPNTNRGGPGSTEFSVTLLPTEDGINFGILNVEVETPFGNVSAASI